MSHFSLQNRVAIITGASSGIGRAAALLFAQAGAAGWAAHAGRHGNNTEKARGRIDNSMARVS